MSANQIRPDPPYFAVIFSSQRTASDPEGYEKTAARMLELASEMPGFLGIESCRDSGGFGMTVSYWSREEDIRHWREHAEHQLAQSGGRSTWYARYSLRVCRVERVSEFGQPGS